MIEWSAVFASITSSIENLPFLAYNWMACSVVTVRNSSVWASLASTVDISDIGIQIALRWSTFGVEVTIFNVAIEV